MSITANRPRPLAAIGLLGVLLLTGCEDTVPTRSGDLPTLTIADAPDVTEGDLLNRQPKFKVTLSEPSAETVTVLFVTNSDTAKAQSDFTSYHPGQPGRLVFEPGDVEQFLGTDGTDKIDIFDDRIDENPEVFHVVIYAPSNAVVDKNHELASVTILDNDDPPVLEFEPIPDIPVPANIVESGGGLTLTFRFQDINGNNTSSGKDIEVPLTLAGGIANGVDVDLPVTVTIPAGNDLYEYDLPLIDDVERDVVFEKTVSVGIDGTTLTNATLGASFLPVNTLLHDDEGLAALNDTGVSTCYDGDTPITCPTAGTPFAGQDAQQAGNAFNFTPYTGTDGNTCMVDNNTGLMWEIKGGTGVQAPDSVYTWYNRYDNINGGRQGVRRSLGTTGSAPCNLGQYCDTAAYVAEINKLNTSGLCGYKDWRVPSINELLSLVHFEAGRNNPTVPAVFTTILLGTYWSATPSAFYPNKAWQVDFRTGGTIVAEKGAGATFLLLVRTMGW